MNAGLCLINAEITLWRLPVKWQKEPPLESEPPASPQTSGISPGASLCLPALSLSFPTPAPRERGGRGTSAALAGRGSTERPGTSGRAPPPAPAPPRPPGCPDPGDGSGGHDPDGARGGGGVGTRGAMAAAERRAFAHKINR